MWYLGWKISGIFASCVKGISSLYDITPLSINQSSLTQNQGYEWQIEYNIDKIIVN